MNLYAVVPSYGPPQDAARLFLAEDDRDALQEGIREAADDLILGARATAVYDSDGNVVPAWRMQYGSPSAEVYLIAENVRHVGTAHASDAPGNWRWAHPAVEEALARHAFEEATGFASDPGELPEGDGGE